MKKNSILVAFILCPWLLPAQINDTSVFTNPAIYNNYRVELVPGKTNYFLGENMLIHYLLINTGKKKLSIEQGGDYRGSKRALRYKVLVLDKNNDTVADPYPETICFGGLGGTFEIARGDTFIHTIALNTYARIMDEGTYTIYITHDLGWKDISDIPVGQLTLHAEKPDETKAAQLVYEMCQPHEESWSWNSMRKPYPDFETIRQPIYFNALKKKALEGCALAWEGIGSIADKNVTRFLLDQLLDEDTSNTLMLSGLLADRLPVPEGFNFWSYVTERNLKVNNGWDKNFVNDAIKIAFKLMLHSNEKIKQNGAYILECVGNEEALDGLLKLITWEIDASATYDPEKNQYPAPASALHSMTTALEVLSKKSKRTPSAGPSSGEWLYYIIKMQQDSAFRPKKCFVHYAQLMQSEIPALRHAALARLRLPIQDEIKPALRSALNHEDITTRNLACEALIRQPANGFGNDILWNLETAENEWLLRSAHQAACSNGLRLESLQQLAQRLDESEVSQEIMRLLSSVVSEGSGSFSGPTREEAEALQDKWTIFLAIHQDEIRNGKIFHIGDKAITADLFPASYEWYLRDGSKWPK